MILGISNSKILKLYRLRKFNLLTTNLVILKFIKKKINKNEKTFIEGITFTTVSINKDVSISLEISFNLKNSSVNLFKYSRS